MKKILLMICLNLLSYQICLAGAIISATVSSTSNGKGFDIAFANSDINTGKQCDLITLVQDDSVIVFNLENTTGISIGIKVLDGTSSSLNLIKTISAGDTKFSYSINCSKSAQTFTASQNTSFKLPQIFKLQFYADKNTGIKSTSQFLFNFNPIAQKKASTPVNPPVQPLPGNAKTTSSFQPTGIELVDALTLSHYIKASVAYDSSVILPILDYYSSTSTNKKIFKNLYAAKTYYQDPNINNKFLTSIIIAISKIDIIPYSADSALVSKGAAQSGFNLGSISNAESAIGNTNITSASDLVAQVIVDHFKEDLTEIFFNHFQNKINDPALKDVWLLLPNTRNELKDIGTDIYNYKKYLTDIRAAFKLDLNSIFDNLPNVINDGTFAAYFDTTKDVKAAALSAIYIAAALLDKEQPGKIIENFPESILDTLSERIDSIKLAPTDKKKIGIKTYQNVIASVRFIKLISKSLRATGSSKYWTSLDTLKLLKNADTRNAYFGLLYQCATGVSFILNKNKVDSLTFRAILNDINDGTLKADTLVTYINQLGKLASNVESASKKLSSSASSDKLLATADFYNSVMALIDTAINVNHIPGLEKLNLKAIRPYVKMMNDGGSIAADISKNEYLLIPTKLLDIYNTMHPNTKSQTDAFTKFINKYGDFIGMMVDAQNTDAIKEALQNSIAGSGGSIVKQKSGLNIAVNSYIGGLLTTNNPRILAITAPIGISISHGFDWSCNGHQELGSITLFASIVDIGAFAAFRLSNDSTQNLPKTTLSNIIAPGIDIILGRLFNTPLSIGFGYQMAPQLRSLTSNSTDVVTNNQWQWQVSLTWDIPLLNICTVQKNTKKQ